MFISRGGRREGCGTRANETLRVIGAVVFLKLGRRPCEKSEWENEEESLLRMGCVRDWLWYEISEESSSIVDSEFDEMVLMSCSLSSFTI